MFLELKTQYCKGVYAIKNHNVKIDKVTPKCIWKYKELRITMVKGHTLVDHDLL